MTAAPPVQSAPPELLQRLLAIGDQNRLRILDALRHGERCVCRLTESLELGQPLLSHHLRVLREVGLVRDRREGRWVHYSLVPEALEEMEGYLATLRTEAETAEPTRDSCPTP